MSNTCVLALLCYQCYKKSTPTQRAMNNCLHVGVYQVKIKNPNDFSAALEKAKGSNQKSILLLIKEGGEVRFVGLKLEK